MAEKCPEEVGILRLKRIPPAKPLFSRKMELKDILFSGATTFRDSVPYSCCSRNVTDECINTKLEKFGSNTINTRGCAYCLRKHATTELWFQFGASSVCITIEIMVLIHLFLNDSDDLKLKKKKS